MPANLLQNFNLSGFNLNNLSESLANSNFIIPLLGAFLVRFLFGQLIGRTLSLLLILGVVYLLFSSEPETARVLNNFSGFGSETIAQGSPTKNPWMLGLVFVFIVYLLRPFAFSPLSLLLFAGLGYLLFTRDFRIASIVDHGQWKTTIVGAFLLLLFLLFMYFRRYRYYPGYLSSVSANWFQPVLLLLALGFAALVVKNPVWLEMHLPGWRSSLGYAVLAGSVVAFLYNLPEKYRPYAISVAWLGVIYVIGRVLLF